MSESLKHLALVKCIVSYIKKNYQGIDHLALLHDLPALPGWGKPPKIGAFRPDVYAVDAPITRTIIGEAKTQLDLETSHSRNQLKDFLLFLNNQQNGLLILAVPWQAKARGKSLLKLLEKEADIKVSTVVIDEIPS